MSWEKRFVRRIQNSPVVFYFDSRKDSGLVREEVLEDAVEVGAVLAHDPLTGRQRDVGSILKDAEQVAGRDDFYLAALNGTYRFYSVVIVNEHLKSS